MSEFTDYLNDVFELFGPITVRRMFGGHGIYHDGLMFALVADEALYLKADAVNAADFEVRGLGRFEYQRQRRRVTLGYYRAPDQIMDDRDEAAVWARRAFEAALRARKPDRAG